MWWLFWQACIEGELLYLWIRCNLCEKGPQKNPEVKQLTLHTWWPSRPISPLKFFGTTTSLLHISFNNSSSKVSLMSLPTDLKSEREYSSTPAYRFYVYWAHILDTGKTLQNQLHVLLHTVKQTVQQTFGQLNVLCLGSLQLVQTFWTDNTRINTNKTCLQCEQL